MKHQKKKLEKQNVGSTSSYRVNNYTKEDVDVYIDTAMMIGFTRKEAIRQMHAIGMYVSK